MILNYIIWDVKPQIVQFDSFEIRWYSLLFGFGFIFGYYIMQRMFKREGISIELLDKLTFYIIIATILGARFGHCLFYEPETYLKAPWRILMPFTGTPGVDFKFTGFQGLASHGGAIGILIGLALYARKYKVNYLWVLDRIAIVTALAAFFIRIGNLFNSEIYGRQTDLPWGFRFMRETHYYGISPDQVVPKHPTQIYEALAYLLIFVLLIVLYNKKYQQLKHGFFIGLFLILVFTSRFFIEFVKEDQVNFEANMFLNMGQLLSIPFVIAGFYLVFRKGKYPVQSKTK
jgi:phosphatidylglycerol---prolipoprotein diacylglyceryl transferase